MNAAIRSRVAAAPDDRPAARLSFVASETDTGVAPDRGEQPGAVTRIARQLGIGPESLRHWVRQAEIDRGSRAGLTTEERARMRELERENRELRRANEILKSAAAFFGPEFDRRSQK